jgi:phosphoglycerate dehydrogenase-like enzyme
MRILVHRRRLDAPLPPGVEVHGMFSRERLTEMLAQADYLVICVPDSSGTDGMIGKTELNALPRHAVIVNIGRGTVIDEPALIEALRAGRLAGAALDVFHKEPLPADSPLWDMPNVIITPHNVSQSDRENDRQIARFTEVLRAYLAGQPLPYLVDKRAGYGVGAPAVQPR